MQFFPLGQLSGACLFIKKFTECVFFLGQFISLEQLSGACLFINDPRDKKRLFFPITVYSRNEKNITLKAITMKTFHWEDSDSDLTVPECCFPIFFFLQKLCIWKAVPDQVWWNFNLLWQLRNSEVRLTTRQLLQINCQMPGLAKKIPLCPKS